MNYIAKFNPYTMDDETILSLATGRKKLLYNALDTLKSNINKTSASQHLLIRAPRGMGKSFFLKYLQIHFKREAIFKNSDFLLLPEEQSNVHTPAELLKLILSNFSKPNTVSEPVILWNEPKEEWENELHNLKNHIDKQRAIYENYILVVVIENLNEFLKNIHSDKKQRKLNESRFRYLLQNVKHFTIIGATPSINTDDIDGNYNNRLFRAFKTYTLKSWTEENYINYFERRMKMATKDKGTIFTPEQLSEMTAKLKAIGRYTGGSPRMAVVLSDLLLKNDIITTSKTLFGLIDDLTPYYQDLIKKIPTKSKLLFDALIRYGEKKTQSELAAKVGATQSQISQAFMWLKDEGYIIGKKVPGKRVFSYQVSDRILVLYYQQREIYHNKNITPILLLSDFLVSFYQEQELYDYAGKLLQEQPGKDALDMAKVYLMASGMSKDNIPDFDDPQKMQDFIKDKHNKKINKNIRKYESEALEFYKQKKYTKAIEYHQKALKLWIKDNNISKQAWNIELIGWNFQELHKHKEAIDFHQKALELRIKENNISEQAWNLGRIGWNFQELHKYKEAIEYYQKALELRIKENNISGQAWNLRQIEWNLQKLNKHKEVIDYHQKTLVLRIKENNIVGQAWNLGRIGWNLQELHKHKEAIEYHQKALKLWIKQNNISEQAWNLEVIGLNLQKLNKYKEAIEYHQKALDLRKKENNISEQAWNLGRIGWNLQELHKHKEAIEYHQKALKLRIKENNISEQAWNLGRIGWNLQKLHKHKEAIEYHQKALELRIKENNISEQAWNLGHIGVNLILLGKWKKLKNIFKPGFKRNDLIFKELGDAAVFIEKQGNTAKAFETANSLLRLLKELSGIIESVRGLTAFFADLLNMKISPALFIDIAEEALSIFEKQEEQIVINAALHTVEYLESGKNPQYLESLPPDEEIAVKAIVEEGRL